MNALKFIASFLGFADGGVRAAAWGGGGAAVLERPAPPPPSSAVAADSIAAKREFLRGKFLGYADLPADFDGYDGRAPAQATIEDAISFIPYVPDAGIAAAEPMVAGDGEVGFHWRAPAVRMEVSFDDEGDISYYGDLPNGGGRVVGGGAYDRAAGPPEELRRLMDAIFPA